MKKIFLALLVSFILCGPAYAQNPQSHPIYFKFGLTQMVTFSENVDHPQINGWTVDVENNFKNNRFLVTAISLGFRRESSFGLDSGNFLNIKAGHSFKVKPFHLSVRAGMEWGKPSTKFSFTKDYGNSYRYTSLDYNSGMPLVAPRRDATLYPVAEFTVGKRLRHTVFETGFRANVLKFRVEDYVFDGSKINTSVKRTLEIAPSVFFNVGFGR